MMTTVAKLHRHKGDSPVIAALNITVLMGGPSEEREVSLNSGKAVTEALKRGGHCVSSADISPADLSALDEAPDLFFIALHGMFGEDGELQAILEDRKLDFVGSDATSSQLAMDKVRAKRRFLEVGLPTPSFQIVDDIEMLRTIRCQTLPAIIKPIRQGSSVDTFLVKDACGFQAAMERVVHKYGKCLIEEYIDGPELTVGIIGEAVLPVCEIKTSREFYDYAAKYQDDTTQYSMAPDLPGTLLREIQALSLRAHQALGCRDFSRVDWMVDGHTHQPHILEINTIPGFTDHSLLPKAAAHWGMSFDKMCQRIVELAMERHS